MNRTTAMIFLALVLSNGLLAAEKEKTRSISLWVANGRTAPLDASKSLERCFHLLASYPEAEAIYFQAEALSNKANQKMVQLKHRIQSELENLLAAIQRDVAELETLRAKLKAALPEKYHVLDRTLTVRWTLPTESERTTLGGANPSERIAGITQVISGTVPRLSRIQLRPMSGNKIVSFFNSAEVDTFMKQGTASIFYANGKIKARDSLQGLPTPTNADWTMGTSEDELLLVQKQSLADSCIQSVTIPAFALIERKSGPAERLISDYETGPLVLSYWATSERIDEPRPISSRNSKRSRTPRVHEW